ncbi:MAG: anti-sigma factor family protein, partial [Mycobacteriales bacterium]
MTLPDVHLAEDALAAYVDGVLSPAADERAERHLRRCAECRAEVDAQREAKALIGAAPDPELPAGLLARLLDVPMTADLGGGDRVLAVAGDELGWATSAGPEDPRLVERSRTAVPVGPGVAPSGRRSGAAARPAGASGPGRPPRPP